MTEPLPSRGRILLVDDEAAFRLATRAFLRQQGFECEVAAGPAEAVQFFSGPPFDLVIADIQMPGNARLEFIEQLAALPGGMRVILLTGHPSMQSAVQSVRLQVAGYLVKPCDPDELVALADQAIARRRAYLAIAANRERLEGWVRDLARLESVLRDDTVGPAGGPTEAYLN
jgi:two-component system response regulator PilR (NtrC family)